MNIHITTIAFLAALLLAPGAHAQPSDRPAAASPVDSFGFLSGIWRGTAWVIRGGKRHDFQQVERVAPYLDGAILLVDGRGMDPANPEQTLFEAFAVISANPETGGFDMRSYSGGRVGTFPATLAGPNTLSWEYRGPDGITRYTHRIEGDRWIGIGEVSKDGKTWTQTLGMDLERVAEASFAPWPTD